MSFEEQDLDSFLDSFEQEGVAISRPVLDEGKYKAKLTGVDVRFGTSIAKKGKNAGENVLWCSWLASFELDSRTAEAKLKRDNAPVLYTDGDTEGTGGGFLNVEPGIGISRDNLAFWAFIGKIAAQAGLAEIRQDESGAKTYNFQRVVLEAIYRNTKDHWTDISGNTEMDELVKPAELAKIQLKQLSELLASEGETADVYLHIQVGTQYKDKTAKRHFIKSIITRAEFESKQSNLDSLLA